MCEAVRRRDERVKAQPHEDFGLGALLNSTDSADEFLSGLCLHASGFDLTPTEVAHVWQVAEGLASSSMLVVAIHGFPVSTVMQGNVFESIMLGLALAQTVREMETPDA